MTVRVLLVDDEELVRSGLRTILDAQDDVDVGTVMSQDEELVAAEQVVDQGAQRLGDLACERAVGDGVDRTA